MIRGRRARLFAALAATSLAGVVAAIVASGPMTTRLPDVCLAAGDSPGGPGAGMQWIPAGRFAMGSEQFRPEEAPVRETSVQGFWIDTHDVTNAQFARFVLETGYVTTAERSMGRGGAPTGSLLFRAPATVQELQDVGQWWLIESGANWRHPDGPGSDLGDRQNHPVVHVSHEDAQAYAAWAGRALPTEAQWEYAARGGRDGDPFVWGADADSDDAPKANYWRGVFPVLNTGSKGYKGTSPVGCFPPNGFGLYDMAGNVWQWTRDAWAMPARAAGLKPGATPVHHAVSLATTRQMFSAAVAVAEKPASSYVIKGGSFLCAANFCMRYRPAARQPGDASTGASHIGFRTVLVP
jgi:formylglycine-generating enzyme required for sulfatase activity